MPFETSETPESDAGVREREELWLLGQPPLSDYLDFVRRAVVDGEAMDRRALIDEWRVANDHYYDARDQRGRGSPTRSSAWSCRRDAAARRRARGEPALPPHLRPDADAFGMVELDRLVVYQRHVTLPFVEALQARLAPPPDPEGLFRFCQPLERRDPPVTIRRLDDGALPVRLRLRPTSGSTRRCCCGPSRSSGFEMLRADRRRRRAGRRVRLELPERDPLRRPDAAAQRLSPRLRAARGRHHPCARRDPDGDAARTSWRWWPPQTVVDEPAFYFAAKRPPLLKDFFDPRLSKVLPVRPMERLIEVSFEVRRVQRARGLSMDRAATSVATSRSDGPLFRPEAVAEQQDRWLGTVLLVPTAVAHAHDRLRSRCSWPGSSGSSRSGNTPARRGIDGWLAPEQGLIQIVAPQSGGADPGAGAGGARGRRGHAARGALGRAAERGAGRHAGRGGARSSGRSATACAPSASRHRALFAAQAAALERRLAVIEAEARELEREVELQRAAARRWPSGRLARQRELRDRAIATEQNLLRGGARTRSTRRLALQTLERKRTTLDARPARARGGARRAAAARGDCSSPRPTAPIAALEQALAEAEAAREIVITAPEAGTRDRRCGSPSGSSVGPDAPLMTLVPAGARLEARLYGPSRAIGFVRPGQRVLLRYEAFPHQKFGQYEGVVTQRLAQHGRAGGARRRRGAAAAASSPGEPVYRVTVELAAQTATAYGEPVPLQPGMQLEADVLIETRRVYQWVLDPLHSLTGRPGMNAADRLQFGWGAPAAGGAADRGRRVRPRLPRDDRELPRPPLRPDGAAARASASRSRARR